MGKGKFPTGASMHITDLYRRKHKTDSKSVNFIGVAFSSFHITSSIRNQIMNVFRISPSIKAIDARFETTILDC